MAWSAPSSVTTGDLITAATWNQDVVDNVQFLYDERFSVYNSFINLSTNPSTSSSTSYTDAFRRCYYMGTQIDESEVSIYMVSLQAVNNGSATGYGELKDETGGNFITSSEVSFTNVGGASEFQVSGDISGDANFPSGDVTMVLYHKVSNGSYTVRTHGFHLIVVG